ncbi:placenta-specific gene 8 protein-like [Symphorus nematophorus]
MSQNMVITQPRPYTMTTVSNQWTSGICDCIDDLPQCCFAYWCFPCFACNTTSEFGECFCLPLMDSLCNATQMMFIPTCVPPVAMSMRVAVRNRYGIQGDMTGDCVHATMCNICSWCQVAREIKRRRQTHTIITAQPPVVMGAQQYMMSTQPGIVTSQATIAAAPQGFLLPRVM